MLQNWQEGWSKLWSFRVWGGFWSKCINGNAFHWFFFLLKYSLCNPILYIFLRVELLREKYNFIKGLAVSKIFERKISWHSVLSVTHYFVWSGGLNSGSLYCDNFKLFDFFFFYLFLLSHQDAQIRLKIAICFLKDHRVLKL